MELTPLKTPGKRRRDKAPTAAPAAKRPKRVKRLAPNSERKKPFEVKASLLEKTIPLEIFERIFWYSENANLPLASPLIGRLLSGLPTLRETFICAFAPTWDLRYGYGDIHEVQEAGTQKDRTGPEWYEGNPDFQSALLEQPWATVPFIYNCWDFWARQHANDTPLPYCKEWLRADSDITNERHSFSRRYEWFRQEKYSPEKPKSSWLVHQKTRIPNSLLVGPWNAEDIQKLFWLVRAGASLSPPDQNWEITHQGFRNAAPTDVEDMRNFTHVKLDALKLLAFLDIFKSWPEHVGREEARLAESICDNAGESPFSRGTWVWIWSSVEAYRRAGVSIHVTRIRGSTAFGSA
ncbi:hypothetical protein AAE478_008407 [Parahypoxylon ruwenzoriense]